MEGHGGQQKSRAEQGEGGRGAAEWIHFESDASMLASLASIVDLLSKI